MTKPPCYNDGSDCPQRHLGCREGCKEWKEWLAIHAEERETMQKNKTAMLDVDTFLARQNQRVQKRYRAEHSKAVREGRK